LLEVDGSLALLICEMTRDSKVGHLQVPVEVNEEVVWLEISMGDEVLMKISQSTHQLTETTVRRRGGEETVKEGGT
jgi:hypothetical protein